MLWKATIKTVNPDRDTFDVQFTCNATTQADAWETFSEFAEENYMFEYTIENVQVIPVHYSL